MDNDSDEGDQRLNVARKDYVCNSVIEDNDSDEGDQRLNATRKDYVCN